MNTFTVAGNVGRDPELRITASGMQVAKFSVADTTGKDDTKRTTWHDIVVFGDQAEHVAESVGKGQRVIVWGRVQKDTYENKDGEKRTKVEIIADEVALSVRWAAIGSTTTRTNEPPEEPF